MATIAVIFLVAAVSALIVAAGCLPSPPWPHVPNFRQERGAMTDQEFRGRSARERARGDRSISRRLHRQRCRHPEYQRARHRALRYVARPARLRSGPHLKFSSAAATCRCARLAVTCVCGHPQRPPTTIPLHDVIGPGLLRKIMRDTNAIDRYPARTLVAVRFGSSPEVIAICQVRQLCR
jgi:hypothetical protein